MSGILVLFICLTVCAQSSDKVKAMRNLRDYYTQNINTYDINQDMGKWDLYLKQLSEEGQFADLAAYEKRFMTTTGYHPFLFRTNRI